MKKATSLLLALTLCLIALASCSGGNSGKDNKKHTHESCEWVIDNKGHYQNCNAENKKINEGKHTVDSDHICTVCKAKVIAYSPENVVVSIFNEINMVETFTEYYNGEIIVKEDTKFEKKGSDYTGYKTYSDGILIEEGVIVKGGKYGYRISQYTSYYSDGNYRIRIYDEHEKTLKLTEYDKNGKEIECVSYENTYSENGVLVLRKQYINERLIEETVYEELSDKKSNRTKSSTYYFSNGEKLTELFDEKEETISSTYYDAGGNVSESSDYEYTYDKDGNVVFSKEYVDGKLYREKQYSYTTYDYAYTPTYISKDTAYYQDEKYIYEYNENNDCVRILRYDSDGELTSESTFKTTYDKYGNYIKLQEFINGELTYEHEYSYYTDDKKSTHESKRTFYDDGYKDVVWYDEDGNTLKEIRYDPDGNVEYEHNYEYTRDENGNPLYEKQYENGELIYEKEYSYFPDDPDSTYVSKETEYYPDGGKYVTIYDNHENIKSETEYDSDGQIVYSEEHENIYNSNGDLVKINEYENGVLVETYEYSYRKNSKETYQSKSTIYYEDSEKLETFYGENGSITSEIYYYSNGSKYVSLYNDKSLQSSTRLYDADGNIIEEFTYEYDFDDNDVLIHEDEYHNGELRSEHEYSYYPDDPYDTYLSKSTIYNPDKSKEIVIYDLFGSVTNETLYDSQGDVTYSFEYEHEYDENGHFIYQKKYDNGSLVYEAEFSYPEDSYFGTYLSLLIEYFSDNTKRVTRYSEDGDIISSVYYDSNGNAIEN
ncbi:MAG: hypothetical protein IJZ03_05810 [Clostridia bacterium]|nr:hypothetical protein [Clostridia bacterium]